MTTTTQNVILCSLTREFSIRGEQHHFELKTYHNPIAVDDGNSLFTDVIIKTKHEQLGHWYYPLLDTEELMEEAAKKVIKFYCKKQGWTTWTKIKWFFANLFGNEE